ncbi:DUF6924 domain-containing protein [Actinomadura roseirufa]|uniref:DUF6924 domain-containing protein n=1 Tax=Actinomadura roseirufa TaxID=2094049 RepID=UPI001040FAF0|nr:hypothetical protein [Actinomadura roseirufa]
MPYPKLPVAAPGEVLLVCTCYEEGKARWGDVFQTLDGRRDGDIIVLEGGEVRLRPVEHPRWNFLHGGNFPALVEERPAPAVVLLADIPVAYGGSPLLAVDLKDVPGRGVRIKPGDLGRVLGDLRDGSVRFDELVSGMDTFGIYRGDHGAPAITTPTAVVRTGFPSLPATRVTLLVRTDFGDDQRWCDLLEALAELNDPGPAAVARREGLLIVDLPATVVDDRAFEHLQPGQVPALVPSDEHAVMVALADAVTFADPAHPLLVVDLYDTPGQAARIPLEEAGSMAANLELANADFAGFV